MVHTIVFQSAREGVGKSTIAANVATLLADRGQRVGVIDADLQSESMRHLFGLIPSADVKTLNDYIFGHCTSEQLASDVTPPIRGGGCVLLVPASRNFKETAARLREGYDVERVTEGLWTMAENLQLDTLIIDTHAMLHDDSLLSMLTIAIADTLAIVLCLDQQDYQGTSVMVDVSRSLEVPNMVLIANQMIPMFDRDLAREQMEKAFQLDVAGLIPHTEAISLLGMADLFVVRYPNHPIMPMFQEVVSTLKRLEAATDENKSENK